MEKKQEAKEAPERRVVVVFSERELILTRKLRYDKGTLHEVAFSL
jgi:hypothetical protein